MGKRKTVDSSKKDRSTKNSRELSDITHLGNRRSSGSMGDLPKRKRLSFSKEQVQNIKENLLCDATPEEIACERAALGMPEDKYPEASVRKKAEKLRTEMRTRNTHLTSTLSSFL